MCIKCRSTGVNEAIDLSRACRSATEDLYLYGLNNLKRYDEGRAPADYPSWPYTKSKVSQETSIQSFQSQLDGLAINIAQQIAEENPGKEPFPDSVSITSESSDDSSSLADISSE